MTEQFETEFLHERCDDLKVANERLTEERDQATALLGIHRESTRLIADLLRHLEDGERIEDVILRMHQQLARV